MKEVDILKDILFNKISNQIFYNESMIHVKNPEARQLFREFRDDEMRGITKLQQKIDRLENKPYTISKIFRKNENN